MLNENIKTIRRQKGITQEELASCLHVVRQTVSKWEKGLSVPDADIIQAIATELDVSVQELLGAEVNPVADRSEIAEQLSRINEQMAIRNRRSALIWKVVGLILAVALIFSTSYIYFNLRSQVKQVSAIEFPDTIEIYNISLKEVDNGFECSFVPSAGNSKMIYTVTLHSLSHDIPDKIETAEYSNGICTVKFMIELSPYEEYNMTLNIRNKRNERNVTILTNLSQIDNGYLWNTPWIQ